MHKYLILFFKIGVIASFIGSICFTVFYLPWFINTQVVENQETLKYIYLTISSLFHLPFGLALLQAYGLLNLVTSDALFKLQVVKRLKWVRISGLSISALHIFAIALMFSLQVSNITMVLLSAIVIVVALMVSSFIYLLEVILSSASAIKEDNDLFI